MSETPMQTISMKRNISVEEESNEVEKSDLTSILGVSAFCNWHWPCSMCQCKFCKLNILRTRIHLPFPLSCSFGLFLLISIFISDTEPVDTT